MRRLSSRRRALRPQVSFTVCVNVAPDVQVVATPGDSRLYHPRLGANLQQLRAILHEYLALAYYRLRGWV
jgi:hypothetical protein